MSDNEDKCCSCRKRPVELSMTHPDAGVDFGRLGTIEVCGPCYTRISQELEEEAGGPFWDEDYDSYN